MAGRICSAVVAAILTVVLTVMRERFAFIRGMAFKFFWFDGNLTGEIML
jgi:hypothetical protein